jgi:hypothetical protein
VRRLAERATRIFSGEDESEVGGQDFLMGAGARNEDSDILNMTSRCLAYSYHSKIMILSGVSQELPNRPGVRYIPFDLLIVGN